MTRPASLTQDQTERLQDAIYALDLADLACYDSDTEGPEPWLAPLAERINDAQSLALQLADAYSVKIH